MPRIDEMFAYVAIEHGPTDEGIIGVKVGDTVMPLVGADIARSESLRVAAQDVCNMMGKPVTLIKFTRREELLTLKPEGH